MIAKEFLRDSTTNQQETRLCGITIFMYFLVIIMTIYI